MRARKKSAMAQLQGHPEIPAETHVFHREDNAFALAEAPMGRRGGGMEMQEAR